jgi:thiamine-monophosphate kinase
LAGGDLARRSPWSAVLTLLGQLPDQGRWLRRDGASVGHRIWLGGSVGISAIGLRLVSQGARLTARGVHLPRGLDLPRKLDRPAREAVRRHLAPSPQMQLGLWLGEKEEGAAMDVSDGLARDLHRLCRSSGVGAQLSAATISPGQRMQDLAAHLGAQAFDLAMFGGEDYVLLFTLPESVAPPAEYECSCIGRIVARTTIDIRMKNGRLEPLPDRGWDHMRDPSRIAGD